MIPSPVEPEIAAALLTEHLDEFFATSPHISDAWERQVTADRLQVVVDIPVGFDRQSHGVRYSVMLDGAYYDSWPPRVQFVEQRVASDGGTEWARARIGSPSFPLIAGSPGAPPGPQVPIQFALHDNYTFPDGRSDQLVCFSYSLDYYLSGHAPTEEQRWQAGRDRLDATLNRLYRVLNSPAYLGPRRSEVA